MTTVQTRSARGVARAAATRERETSGARTPAAIRAAVSMLRLVTAPTRLSILYLLAERERSVGEICRELGMQSQPALSHQLAILRHGRLVEGERRGRRIIYRLTPAGRGITSAFGPMTEAASAR
jgi:ArsR family transcriptional regulator, zinc-responsive transcriptional repressor